MSTWRRSWIKPKPPQVLHLAAVFDLNCGIFLGLEDFIGTTVTSVPRPDLNDDDSKPTDDKDQDQGTRKTSDQPHF